MAAHRKYPVELRERAVRLYRESNPKPVIAQPRRIPLITAGTAPAGYQAAQAQPRAAAAATPPGGHGRAHT